jgi:hypothetical protein
MAACDERTPIIESVQAFSGERTHLRATSINLYLLLSDL